MSPLDYLGKRRSAVEALLVVIVSVVVGYGLVHGWFG